jgi:malate dehydrogenase (quinone)
MEDRDLKEAGYRVQIIKPDPKQGGTLQFGTEVIISQDGTLATLLGASPGASTSVDIMLHVIESCFPQYLQDQQKIEELIPSYGKKLNDDEKLLNEVRTRTHQVLGI